MSRDKPNPPPDGDLNLLRRTKPSVFGQVRNNFFAGIVVAAPIGITVAIVYWFITGPMAWVDSQVRGFIPDRFNPERILEISIPGLGVLFAVIALVILGALAKNLFGRIFISIGEQFVGAVPVVRVVYRFFKNVFETVLSQTETTFQEVVLVEWPRRDLWAIAFVTSQTKGEVQAKTEGEVVNVFLPSTPNPTTGYLMFAHKSDLIYLEMTVEEAAKMIISGGLVTPAYAPKATNGEDVSSLAINQPSAPPNGEGAKKRFLLF